MVKLQNLPKVVKFDFNKHLPQSSADKTNDLFFILATVFIAIQEDKELTQLALEKALFKASQILSEKNYSFLNTFFFVNTYGPHNNIFYKYLEELESAGLTKSEGKSIYLTAKGLRVTSEMLEEIAHNQVLQEVFLALKQKIKDYSRPGFAVKETHSQKVIDTTDNNRQKTIGELINEINPRQQFTKGSQFKYIEPASVEKAKKIQIPPRVINELESILANIESTDFEQKVDISCLFQ